MKLFNILSFIVLVISLSACSINQNASTQTIDNMQKVEIGTIVSIKTVALKPEEINSYGNVGVSVGSGGHSGIYGGVDLATIGKLYRNATKPTTAQQFIITKNSGETIAITQLASKEVFRIGDSVKMVLQGGKAKVFH
jgi:outer membrane lipoprotein SlyB